MVHPPPCHWHGGGWTRHHNIGSVQNTVTYGYDTGSWGDLLISFNGQSIAYDGIGNPGTWNGSALTWQGRRLMSYGSNTYTYNADGIRTSKTVNGVEHIYHLSGTQILSEEWTEGNVQHILIFVYDASGQPIGMSHYENGEQRGTYVFVKNIQGDITGIYDDEGTCLVTYTYDAWGNVTVSYSNGGASTAAKYNPLRYRGYYYDTETGLYYVSSRYYDPEIGRFINADTTDILTATPMGLTDKNLFAYCDNNPVMRADHGGDFWHIVVGAAVGALIGGVVKAVSNAIEGKSLTDGLATAMLAGAASGALASTGVGIVGMVAGNAAISMAENAADQVIENKGFNNFDVGDMLIEGAIGGVSGALGGTGKGTKHLTNLGKQTVKRTFNATTNKGLRAGLKEAGKAFAYYGKNSAKYYKTFVKGLPSDFISTVGTTIASSNYMKYQYRRIFGR